MRNYESRLGTFKGTFVPEVAPKKQSRKQDGLFPWEFILGIDEDEKRFAGSERDVTVDDIPAENPDVSEGEVFYTMPGTLEESLAKLLAFSPVQALKVYTKARNEMNEPILMALPGVIRSLVEKGVYSAHLFQQTHNGRRTYYRTFKDFGKDCPVARDIFAGLTSH